MQRSLRCLSTSSRAALAHTTKTIITTANAPSAIGPYSQGVAANGTLYVSGCIGLRPEVCVILYVCAMCMLLLLCLLFSAGLEQMSITISLPLPTNHKHRPCSFRGQTL